MYCTNCGKPVLGTDRFCRSCGERLGDSVGTAGDDHVANELPSYTSVDFHATSAELRPLAIHLIELNRSDEQGGEEPLKVTFEISNNTKRQLNLVDVKVFVFDSTGLIAQADDVFEGEIPAGGDAEFESAPQLLHGVRNVRGHALRISVMASAYQIESVESVDVTLPEYESGTVFLEPMNIGTSNRLVYGSIHTYKAGDRASDFVAARLLFQNISKSSSSRVKSIFQILGQNDQSAEEVEKTLDEPINALQVEQHYLVAARKISLTKRARIALTSFRQVAFGVAHEEFLTTPDGEMTHASVINNASVSGRSGVSASVKDEYEEDIDPNELEDDEDSDDAFRFNCRELVFVLSMTDVSTLRTLDLSQRVDEWREELEDHSVAYPLYVGSDLDDADEHLGLDWDFNEAIEEPLPNTIYVLLYYYYDDSVYQVSEHIDDSWEVVEYPIINRFVDESENDRFGVMLKLTRDGHSAEFECVSSSDGSEKRIAMFRGNQQIMDVSLSLSTSEIVRLIRSQIGK